MIINGNLHDFVQYFDIKIIQKLRFYRNILIIKSIIFDKDAFIIYSLPNVFSKQNQTKLQCQTN